MLTNNDLRSIGRIIDEKLETKLEEKLETKLEEKLGILEERLGTKLEEKLETKLEEKLETKLKPIKRDIAKIRKDQNTIINYFDREYLGLNERMRRVENYLHLPVIQ